MLSLTTIPSHNPEIIARILEDEAVLVLPVQGKVKVLNEVGARIWTLIDGATSTEAIIHTICQEFDTTPEVAAQDVNAFLTQLAERDMISFA
jgi:hypothetical protein